MNAATNLAYTYRYNFASDVVPQGGAFGLRLATSGGQGSLHRSIFLASVAAEKMAAMRTLDYLRQEAAKGRREEFEWFLAAVPDEEPSETDVRP